MKNIKKFVRLYLEDLEAKKAKWGTDYPPQNWEEFEESIRKTHYKYFVEEEVDNPDIRTGLLVSLLADDFVDFGYYAIFSNLPLDFQDLNNVIYQIARSQHLNVYDLMVTGTRFHYILRALAANDTEPADTFLPDDAPCYGVMRYADMVVNLFLVVYRKREDLRERAVALAEKYLKSKRSLFDRSMVEYLMALIDRDAKRASKALQEVCNGYQKRGDVDWREKCFVAEIHGLYRLAKFVDEELFAQLKRPEHPSFLQEFEDWQQANGYPKGQLFYSYPEEMDYLNRILRAKLPTLSMDELRSEEKTGIIFARRLNEEING